MSTNSELEKFKVIGKKPLPSAAEIKAWLVHYIAEIVQMEPEEIDPTIPFERYGIDSEDGVILSGDLEDWLGYDLDPTLIFDYPTPESLVEYIEKRKLINEFL